MVALLSILVCYQVSIEYGSYMVSGKLEEPPSESTDIYISGTFRGSIGQEGAVGAFLWFYYY